MGSQITMSTIKALSPFKPCFLVFLSILLIVSFLKLKFE